MADELSDNDTKQNPPGDSKSNAKPSEFNEATASPHDLERQIKWLIGQAQTADFVACMNRVNTIPLLRRLKNEIGGTAYVQAAHRAGVGRRHANELMQFRVFDHVEEIRQKIETDSKQHAERAQEGGAPYKYPDFGAIIKWYKPPKPPGERADEAVASNRPSEEIIQENLKLTDENRELLAAKISAEQALSIAADVADHARNSLRSERSLKEEMAEKLAQAEQRLGELEAFRSATQADTHEVHQRRYQSRLRWLDAINEAIAEFQPDDPEPVAEPVPEPADRTEPEPAEPSDALTVHAAIDLIYQRRENETCESIRAVLSRLDMTGWQRDDVVYLAEHLDGVCRLDEDHKEMAHIFCSHEQCPVVFLADDGVLIYENNGLRILNWPHAMARIEPSVAQTRDERETRRREDEGRAIIHTKLPPKRKLKAMVALIARLIELKPTMSPTGQQAIEFIRAMKQDDERFSDCQTFSDYLNKAVKLTEVQPDDSVPERAQTDQAEPEPMDLDEHGEMDRPLPKGMATWNTNPPRFAGKPSRDDAELAELRAFVIRIVEAAGLPTDRLNAQKKAFWRKRRNAKSVREIVTNIEI